MEDLLNRVFINTIIRNNLIWKKLKLVDLF